MTIRVVLADDQAVVREGLALLLSTASDLNVVGVAEGGREALRLVADHRPDVLLSDLRMPDLDGVAVTTEVVRDHPSTRVLVLTTFADDEALLPALRAGAAGYLTKDTTGEALLDAVRRVAAGQTVLDPAVQRRLVALVTDEPAGTPAAPRGDGERVSPPAAELAGGLTRRELDVVRLVAEGLSNAQVANRLVVSEATVKTHLNHVLSKLDLDGRAALVAWAFRRGVAR